MKYLDYWIFREYSLSKEELAIFRIIFTLYVLLLAMPSYTWITFYPDFLYNPPVFSLAVLFKTFPPALFFYLINTAIYSSVVFVLFGYYTKQASIILTLTQIIASHFAFSFGKIDHSILYIITPAIMGLAGWGNAFSIDAQCRKSCLVPVKPHYISLLVLIIGFGYFSSGYFKLMNSWIDWDINTHAARTWGIMTYYREERRALLGYSFTSINNHLFWEFLDYITVLLELSLLIVIINQKVFQIVLLILTFFHIVIYLTIGIPFFIHIVIFGIFFPWRETFHLSNLDSITEKVLNFRNLLISLFIVIPSFLGSSIYQSMPAAFYCVNPLGLLFDLFQWDYYNFTQYITLTLIIIPLTFLVKMKCLKYAK